VISITCWIPFARWHDEDAFAELAEVDELVDDDAPRAAATDAAATTARIDATSAALRAKLLIPPPQ
jgi:hypothetical protein